ncbi:hypothetical protein ACVZHT_39590, partial [Vibrio diabolicus]
ARRTHHMTAIIAAGLTKGGFELAHNCFFDTITINTGSKTEELYAKALSADINLRLLPGKLGISCDETTTVADVEALFA